MPAKRIDTATSRTAEWTCLARACSSQERDRHLRCDDYIAIRLVPGFVAMLLRTAPFRAFYRRFLAPRGVYEYVAARTKYIDAAFGDALTTGCEQVVLFGAGFDTRALRFQSELRASRVFELDVPITQAAKLGRYHQRQLIIPYNLTSVAIDFDRESITAKLREAGFRADQASLFILEGVLMYLRRETVDATFATLGELACAGSRVAFDYIRSSVLRGDTSPYGAAAIARSVEEVNEKWHSGMEPDEVAPFLSRHGFRPLDHSDAAQLEQRYFTSTDGRAVARVNGTHCLVTAEKLPG